jgi:hypothetical protein
VEILSFIGGGAPVSAQAIGRGCTHAG